MPRTKKSQPWSKKVTAENSTVEVRIFERQKGGPLYIEVRGVRGLADGKERKSLGHRDRGRAEDEARAVSAELAAKRLSGLDVKRLRLGQLFTKYRLDRLPDLSPARQKEALARITMFTEAWGGDVEVADIDQTCVDRYCRLRRSMKLLAPGKRERTRGYRPPQAIRDGGLDAEFRWLASVLNWATGVKVGGGNHLLPETPLRGVTWPKESRQNLRRPIASHQRFEATLEHADAVDPKGRLRCILTLARHTGRRETAICSLLASDLLFTQERIRAALADQGLDERDAERMKFGAIRWSAEIDKQGYAFVTPISSRAREALDTYLRQTDRLGDAPLFPAPKPRIVDGKAVEVAIRRETAMKWLVKAERLAGLPKLTGGVFHPYRRLWATERKHLSSIDVAAAGGWGDTQALTRIYQQPEALRIFEAVQNSA